MNDWNVSEAAAALHRDALVWDMTLPWLADCEPKKGTLERFIRSGFNVVGLTVDNDSQTPDQTLRYIGAVKASLRSRPDVVLVRSVDDIVRAKQDGKLALELHFQGTNALDGDINLVQSYYELGIRHMLLAYNQKNKVGDGCHERTDAGLSRFGVKLVAEMNRVGMVVDCTHTGYRTTMEAMELTTAPCIFSHSGSRVLNDHERNIWDDQAQACARTGGVIGVNGIGFFLSADGQANAEQMVRHIEHFAQLVGPQHVGLGFDFVFFDEHMMAFYYAHPEMYPKGYPAPPWQYVSPEVAPRITDLLLRRGYKEADVRGILGENFLRVCRQVWK